ncbi:MAG: sigma-E processing peptidase SpoIIGA [Tissierellaceae bacterium]|nr:sigma-E processing peptidase SpoIIGA [Tissierellaceae bacterium]
MYIILEYYLLENFFINFLVLYTTNKITKSKIKTKGIIIGTIISTLYSLIIFLPSLLFLTSFIFKIIISAIIIYITFNSKSIKTFLYQWLCFYIVSFIFAGAIMSLTSNFTNITKAISKEINLFKIFEIKHIIVGIIIALLISIIVFSYNHRKKQIEKLLVDAKISIKDQTVIIKALVDTGNSLKDPLSNRNVFVVELSKLHSILPDELINFYRDKFKTNIEDILLNLMDKFPITLVPFKSIGNDNGIILGFKPDSVIIRLPNEGEDIELSKIIIGIYNGHLSNEGEFSGLLDYESIVEKEEI